MPTPRRPHNRGEAPAAESDRPEITAKELATHARRFGSLGAKELRDGCSPSVSPSGHPPAAGPRPRALELGAGID
jgi:hypothetical protein